jgi:hypothetical protein
MGEGGKTSGAVLENLQELRIIKEISSLGGYGYFLELHIDRKSVCIY